MSYTLKLDGPANCKFFVFTCISINKFPRVLYVSFSHKREKHACISAAQILSEAICRLFRLYCKLNVIHRQQIFYGYY